MIYFVEIVPALVIVAGFQQLVPLMIAAMALNSLVLVLPLVYLAKLAGDERVMGAYRNGKVRQIMTWALVVTLVVVSILAFAQSLRGRGSLPWPGRPTIGSSWSRVGLEKLSLRHARLVQCALFWRIAFMPSRP